MLFCCQVFHSNCKSEWELLVQTVLLQNEERLESKCNTGHNTQQYIQQYIQPSAEGTTLEDWHGPSESTSCFGPSIPYAGMDSVVVINKYEKHFPKMLRDVGMAAVPKTTQTRYMDGSVQATQRTTQVTPSLHLFFFHFCYPFPVISQQGLDACSIQKKRRIRKKKKSPLRPFPGSKSRDAF